MSQLVLPTKFTAIDGMSGPVKIMGNNIHQMAEKANIGIARQERIFRKLVPSISNAAKQLINYGTAGLGLSAVGFSGKAIMDYETSIQSLQAVTGVSDKQMESFKKEIVDTATKTKKSAIDVAGSFEVIGSAMSQYLTDPKALNQISNAGITLAKASRQELVPTLENLTSIMNQFDLKASQAEDTINRLTAGEIVGSLRTTEVADALKEFGAGAYASNVNLSESVALVEALGKQLKTDKIGVGARNILTVMDSAKGLDKKARQDLRKSGVDLNFLMDKTKSLSERLHELSKISGNSTVITSVFGKENKTAAQVIFNQLGVYDQYVAKIKVTNEAQNQALINSNTLANKITQLKDRWINYIATSDNAAKGLNTLKDAAGFVADNIDNIVNVVIKAVTVMAVFKGVILAQQIAMGAYNATIVIYRAISQAYFLVDMVKYVAVTKGMTTTTAALSIAQAELNTIWLANPIGIMIGAVALLAGGIYLLAKQERDLNEQTQRMHDLAITTHINEQSEATKKLADHWKELGYNIHDATVKALQFQMIESGKKLQEAKQRKQNADAAEINAYDNAIFPAFSNAVQSAEEETLAASRALTLAQSDKLGITNSIINNGNAGILNNAEMQSLLNGKKVNNTGANPLSPNLNTTTDKFKDNSTIQEMNNNIGGLGTLQSSITDAIKEGFKNANQSINISGLPTGAKATTSNSITPKLTASY